MSRFFLLLNSVVGVFFIFCFFVLGDDSKYLKDDHAYAILDLNRADNRVPMSLDRFKDLVSREGWRLMMPRPKDANEMELNSSTQKGKCGHAALAV
jgi:hypothetical protein